MVRGLGGSEAFPEGQVGNNGGGSVTPMLPAKTQGQKCRGLLLPSEKGVRPFRPGSTAEELCKTS